VERQFHVVGVVFDEEDSTPGSVMDVLRGEVKVKVRRRRRASAQTSRRAVDDPLDDG